MYTVGSGVTMSPWLHAAAQKIADNVPFDIKITSGIRSHRGQAAAMFGIIRSAGYANRLIEVYADDVYAQGVIDAWNNGENLDQATQFITDYYEWDPHGHYAGGSLDIRTTAGSGRFTLSEEEIAELIQAVSNLGYEPQREYTPPHLHVIVGGEPTGAPTEEPTVPKKNNLLLMAMVGIGIWMFLS